MTTESAGPDPRNTDLRLGDVVAVDPGAGWEVDSCRDGNHAVTWRHGAFGWGRADNRSWAGKRGWNYVASTGVITLVAFHPDRAALDPAPSIADLSAGESYRGVVVPEHGEGATALAMRAIWCAGVDDALASLAAHAASALALGDRVEVIDGCGIERNVGRRGTVTEIDSEDLVRVAVDDDARDDDGSGWWARARSLSAHEREDDPGGARGPYVPRGGDPVRLVDVEGQPHAVVVTGRAVPSAVVRTQSGAVLSALVAPLHAREQARS